MPVERTGVERAFVRARLRAFATSFWHGRWIIAAFLIVLGIVIYFDWSPQTAAGVVEGEVVGGRVRESDLGDFPYLDVRLVTGRVVSVRVPRGQVFASGSRVELWVTEYERPVGQVVYSYARRAAPREEPSPH